MSLVNQPWNPITDAYVSPFQNMQKVSLDEVFKNEYSNTITPYKTFKNHFKRIHKRYPETNITNIENLVDKLLNDEDSFFLSIVRDKTELKNTFFNRFFETKTPLGKVLKELQNSQESPNRELLDASIIKNADIEAKKLLDDFLRLKTSSKKTNKLNDLQQKRREQIAIKVGSEFQINNFTTWNQESASSATSNIGNIIATWESANQDGDGFGIYGQILNPNGTKIGFELPINNYTISDQRYPSVVALNDGNFFVTWVTGNIDISGQILNPNGSKIGSEFLVNSYSSVKNAPSNAVLTNGNIVAIWPTFQQDGDGLGIYGQMFNPNGTKIGSEFQVNNYTNNGQLMSSTAALSNGNFVVVWASLGQDGDGFGIYGQIFNPDGSRVGVEFPVNTYTTSNQQNPFVLALSNGNFVVLWQSFAQDGSRDGIFGQIFYPNGTKIDSEFPVNTYILNDQQKPSASALSDGKFVATWESTNQDEPINSLGVYGQIFNSDGTKIGSEFPVNTYVISNQCESSTSTLTNGNFIVIWQSVQDLDGYGIYGQIFDLRNISTSSTISSTLSHSTTSLAGLSHTTSKQSSNPKYKKIVLGITIPVMICLAALSSFVYLLKRKRKLSSLKGSEHLSGDYSKRGSSSFVLSPVLKRAHKEIGGEYLWMSKIDREDAEDIYIKTGHLIIVPEDKMTIKHKVGNGHFGKIRVGRRISDGEYVAIKKVKKDKMEDSREEAQMQKDAEGENILPIYNTSVFDNVMYHFMPLAGFGSGVNIQEQLSRTESINLKTEIIKYVAKDLLSGLKNIHEKGIYHLDIKADNIVFKNDGTAMITDFGCAKKDKIVSKALGDIHYVSPERLMAFLFDDTFDAEKADMWASGVMLLCMYKNEFANNLFSFLSHIDGLSKEEILDRFEERLSFIEELKEPKNGSIWWVIKSLLNLDPESRFTAKQALDAACFKGIDISKKLKAKVFNDIRAKSLTHGITITKEINIDDYNFAAQMRSFEDSENKEKQEFLNSYDFVTEITPDDIREKRNSDYIFSPDNDGVPEYIFSPGKLEEGLK